MSEHRNKTHVQRSIWVTIYSGNTYDEKIKPDLPAEGELVGWYDIPGIEKELKKRFGFRVVIDNVEHQQVPCKMHVEDFYKYSMKEI